jgi:hypothetical protein
MTWEQKLAALQSLGGGTIHVKLHMRKPGDWYLHTGLGIGHHGFSSWASASGETPEQAVENSWLHFTEGEAQELFVLKKHMDDRGYRWNGFMWQEHLFPKEAV